MRWPFVSRSTLDAVHAAWRESNRQYATIIAAGDTRYADLMASYRQLRLQGANEPTPRPAPEPKDETVTAITRAIREQAGGNVPLMKIMYQQVAIDRGAGLSDLAILDRINRRTPADLTSDGVPA